MNSLRSGRESVRRNLFGPVDHEQLRRELKLRLGEIAQQDSRRWNFNFQAQTPLPGRFEWEEIPTEGAAHPYREYVPRNDAAAAAAAARPPSAEDEDAGGDGEERLGGREGGREEMESAAADQENCSRVSNTPKFPAEATPARRKRAHPRSAAKPRDNARITDFFVKRRRTSEMKSITNSFGTSEAALCKTIR